MAAVFGVDAILFFGWVVVVLLIVLIGLISGLVSLSPKTSTFTGDPNNIRQYVQVGDESQNERQARAVANNRLSGMTGSRDIPVFFQDYDYDMTLGKTGLVNAREGLTDPSVVDKLNKLGG